MINKKTTKSAIKIAYKRKIKSLLTIIFLTIYLKLLHKKQIDDKNIVMENSKNLDLINTSYQTSKQILQVLDNFLTEIKNEKFQKVCANFVSDYDLIIDECKMLVKSYNKELEEIGFFDKYQNIISLKISNLTKKTDYEIAEILYLTVCESNPRLYSLLSFSEYDEINLIKKILSLNEEFIDSLNQFFVSNKD